MHPVAVRVGVLILQLVEADVAGIVFTGDPVTCADELVIEADSGSREKIVQGLVVPDRSRIGSAEGVIQRVASFEDIAVRRDPDGSTLQQVVVPELAESPCRTTTDLDALGSLVPKSEGVSGPGPHVVAWALSGGRWTCFNGGQ
ncbi:hypothetical protein OU426_06575 [Frigidibacter sp. RF13]|uniref:PEP/pyruvate-binding domain-containing protein n=1 Tax=Frigidibacter sp. RF13 TaxID=2997340 RepID=UPI00226F4419|nr:PEP/pyruvate-binding domain-containing protein [Frigidibacter sp. RF13]MCY1126514.1 hypothetical protein [Frigidibacter sp. RF13]